MFWNNSLEMWNTLINYKTEQQNWCREKKPIACQPLIGLPTPAAMIYLIDMIESQLAFFIFV